MLDRLRCALALCALATCTICAGCADESDAVPVGTGGVSGASGTVAGTGGGGSSSGTGGTGGSAQAGAGGSVAGSGGSGGSVGGLAGVGGTAGSGGAVGGTGGGGAVAGSGGSGATGGTPSSFAYTGYGQDFGLLGPSGGFGVIVTDEVTAMRQVIAHAHVLGSESQCYDYSHGVAYSGDRWAQVVVQRQDSAPMAAPPTIDNGFYWTGTKVEGTVTTTVAIQLFEAGPSCAPSLAFQTPDDVAFVLHTYSDRIEITLSDQVTGVDLTVDLCGDLPTGNSVCL